MKKKIYIASDTYHFQSMTNQFLGALVDGKIVNLSNKKFKDQVICCNIDNMVDRRMSWEENYYAIDEDSNIIPFYYSLEEDSNNDTRELTVSFGKSTPREYILDTMSTITSNIIQSEKEIRIKHIIEETETFFTDIKLVNLMFAMNHRMAIVREDYSLDFPTKTTDFQYQLGLVQEYMENEKREGRNNQHLEDIEKEILRIIDVHKDEIEVSEPVKIESVLDEKCPF